jgi:hypothetical protein
VTHVVVGTWYNPCFHGTKLSQGSDTYQKHRQICKPFGLSVAELGQLSRNRKTSDQKLLVFLVQNY